MKQEAEELNIITCFLFYSYHCPLFIQCQHQGYLTFSFSYIKFHYSSIVLRTLPIVYFTHVTNLPTMFPTILTCGHFALVLAPNTLHCLPHMITSPLNTSIIYIASRIC
jgi:hypothetical protein